MTSRSACVICENTRDLTVWTAREMMFGFRDRFDYAECPVCGGLTLIDPPADMGHYYPPGYYAHGAPRREPALKRFLWRYWIAQSIGERSALGALLLRGFGPPHFAHWLRLASIARNASVLEVGCGTGWLLRHLRAAGWRHLTGIDPFLARDVTWPDGVALLRRTIDQMHGQYDVIMAHHAFEHIPDPRGAARDMARLLAPGGLLVIRTPAADSEAWRTYRTDWANLDAPRHYFIPTTAGMRRIADQAGLRLERVMRDSQGDQFWLSEQYRRDIPRVEAFRIATRDGCLGTKAERERDIERARQLNDADAGDCACYFLRHERAG
jgi:SAM-dependent methyltransferase